MAIRFVQTLIPHNWLQSANFRHYVEKRRFSGAKGNQVLLQVENHCLDLSVMDTLIARACMLDIQVLRNILARLKAITIKNEKQMKKLLATSCIPFVILGLSSMNVLAQQTMSKLPMDRVYQGHIVLPDFKERDKAFSNYRTRISEEMKTGPNFAGHYAIVVIGCGTACRFAFMGDVANGQLYPFPYGGEENYDMDLRFNVKQNNVAVRWISEDNCLQDYLTWNGSQFKSQGVRRLGNRGFCEAS